MSGLRSRVSPLWQVLRHRRPEAAARVEEAALGARGQQGLTREVRVLRARLAELQRDHLLLAAHVAVLTERLGGPVPTVAPDDAEPARQRARLAAIAAYEQRIGALEEAVTGRGGRSRTSGGRTPDERRVRAS